MNQAAIKAMQARIGVEADGFWGVKSIAACQKHLRSMMPSPNPWPATDQASLTRFYGAAGDTSKHTTIEPPYKMYLYKAPEIVKRITVHEKCAESLLRVLKMLKEVYPTEEARLAAGVSLFFGVYANRPMRGGSLPSMHARAAAIDLDAGRNGNLTAWPSKAVMPLEVMECFAREGWKSAGAFWSRDSMHAEATR